MSEIKNINLDSLKKTHGDNAENVFQKVAEIGGFGAIEPNYKGGLDISGLPEGKYNQVIKLITVEETEPVAEPKTARDKKEPDNTATKNK
jgi:hypothetical protein